MDIFYRLSFKKELQDFPPPIQRKFAQQAAYLVKDIRHPSLRAKKYDETQGIWQARGTKYVRFYFLIEGNTYVLLNITYHPK